MIGKTLGARYKIYDKVGGGGMAEVYLARDLQTGEIVALKVLRDQYTEGNDYIERFQREAKSAMKLTHPNICGVKDFGSEDDTYFMVMEFVEGKTLSHFIEQKGPLPVDEAVKIIRQSAQALQEAYKSGIIAHRDVKSQNLMITPLGQVKMMDFGIAKSRDFATMTTAGSFVGTPEYMSPEQAQGIKVDSRSDLYSLGVVLYEALAGEVPFEADTPWGVLNMHINKQPFPLTNLRNDVPEDLVHIISHLLAKNPDDRFQTPAELITALDLVMKDYKTPKSDKVKSKRIPRSNPRIKRAIRKILVTVFVLVLVAGGLAAYLFFTAPKAAKLSILTEPNGAIVYLKNQDEDNFREIGRTNLEIKKLIPGKYSIRVAYKGYTPQTVAVEMKSGEDLNLPVFILKKVGKVDPVTANLDWGRVSGELSEKKLVLKNVGESPIDIKLIDHDPWILMEFKPFTIGPGEKIEVIVRLDPYKVNPGKTYTGKLDLKDSLEQTITVPVHVEVVGKVIEKTDKMTGENTKPSGNETVKPPDEGQNPPSATTGLISITSNPPGAAIKINGSPAGTTPLTLSKSPAVYSIEIIKGGYKIHRGSVTVKAGKTALFSATLRK